MIQKALVPIAGKGTRLLPVTSVLPKALLPIVERRGTIRCVIHLILEEILAAGIEHVGIIASAKQADMLQEYFESVSACGHGGLPADIEYVIQSSPKGFGNAVLLGGSFVGDDPFLLLLGDHIHLAQEGKPRCAVQVVSAFDSSDGVSMVGVQQISARQLSRVGVVSGNRLTENTYLCTNFIEKPDPATARKTLVTGGLPDGMFLAHCGIYAFGPDIFDCLSQVDDVARKRGGEAELADAQSLLLERHPDRYFLCEIAGRAYDVGTPGGYGEAQIAFQGRTMIE